MHPEDQNIRTGTFVNFDLLIQPNDVEVLFSQ